MMSRQEAGALPAGRLVWESGNRMIARHLVSAPQGNIPHSSPEQQRCAGWDLVPGERGSEAGGKDSFEFHGQPERERTDWIE